MSVQITKENFLEYKEAIQKNNEFNPYDPRAREMTSLSEEQWFEIIRNYKSLNNAWGKDEES